MLMFTCSISVNVLSLSAVISTDWQWPLQVCTYRHNRHRHHAAEHRCRSCLRQEIRLWWQVSISFHNQVKQVLFYMFCMCFSAWLRWFYVSWQYFECVLQVLGSQVLRAAAACRGQHCWGDGWPAGDQPHSKWQDRVSWRLRWGTVDTFSSFFPCETGPLFGSRINSMCVYL